MRLLKIDVGQKPCAFDDVVLRGQESFPDRMSGAFTKGLVTAHENNTSRRAGACLPPIESGNATGGRKARRYAESDNRSVRTAIRRGGLTFICCFLLCMAFSVPPVIAEDTTTVPYKDWWEYSEEEKKFLRDRWTDEKVEAVVTALKEKRPLAGFVDRLSGTTPMWGFLISRADLRGISLRRIDLPMVDLKYACLQGADLSGADLQGANLSVADLQGADLKVAHLQGADLWEADLQASDVSWAHLQGAGLRMAHLQGANLFGADLQGAYLWGAIFDRTHLYRPKLDSTVGYRDIEWINGYVGNDLLTYNDLKRLYRNVGMDELVTEFHYWENGVKTRQGSFPNYIVRLFFLELTYGYGSRPWWPLRFSLPVIGLFTTVFYIRSLFPRARAGIYMTKQGDTRKKRLAWRHPHECLFASLLAFATVGYGALRPKQWLQFFRMRPVDHQVVGWIRIFVGIEAALGIWVLALLVMVLFGR